MVFVYALSIPLLRERPTAGKTAAVLLSCCGLALLVPSGDASADGGADGGLDEDVGGNGHGPDVRPSFAPEFEEPPESARMHGRR